MSQALVNQIRKQREFKKAVTDAKTGRVYTFICRRPTDQDAAEIQRGETRPNLCQRFVVGWEDVTENDVVGGGGSDVLEFDPLLWREWVADRRDFWEPIAEAILDAYSGHAKEMDDAAKNSQPGSNNAT
jgi:hypothetical protein